MKRHGGLLVDEMKLSAHLDMQSSTHIEGFVDLGQFTDVADKHTKADHGLVVMFQPLVGSWTQIIGEYFLYNFYFKQWAYINQVFMCMIFYRCIRFQRECKVQGARKNCVGSNGAM